MVWARADRPARMLVEVATTETFRDIGRAVFVDALPESDFTAKALLDDLPPGQDIFYRISFQDLSSAVFGEAQVGHFRTASADRRWISFVWSLLNSQTEVIGINTWVRDISTIDKRQVAGADMMIARPAQGLNFAVSAPDLRNFLSDV